MKFSFYILFLFFIISSCKEKKDSIINTSNENYNNSQINFVTINANQSDLDIKHGEKFSITFDYSDTLLLIDSIKLMVDNKTIQKDTSKVYQYTIPSNSLYVGIHQLSIDIFYSDSTSEKEIQKLIIRSSVKPINYSYKIKKTYPHDINAYTQGLIFENGFLYESTGQWGSSSLRKISLETGKLIQSIKMENEIFAEGMTIINDKIYQLTYKNRVGFVYDKKNFTLLNRFYYENFEGWGLTNDGKNLIMSDGSNKLFYIDYQTFSLVKVYEVYDQDNPVLYLNELETIDGKIYANVYQSNIIVIINPETGEVIGKIDLKNLLNPSDYHKDIDVLNGIAYDKVKDCLYVTGKNWPKLFDIDLVTIK